MSKIKARYDTLSYGKYPDAVISVLEQTGCLSPGEIEDLFESEFGPDLLESKSENVIERVNNRTPKSAKEQLLGILGTLHYYRGLHDMHVGQLTRNDPKIRFDVATLSNGSSVFLLHPGYKAFQNTYLGPHPMDIAVNIENWENPKGNTTPLHKELFSDLYWKFKEARIVRKEPEMANRLTDAINELHRGIPPNEVLSEYKEHLNFSVGNRFEPLFHSLFWIFIQEDLNYAKYGGRDTPHRVIEDIASLPASEIDTTEERFPDTVTEDQHEPYYEIIDNIKGYDRNDGELLPVTEITQPAFTLK